MVGLVSLGHMRQTYTPEGKEKLIEAVLTALEDDSTTQACKASGVPLPTFLRWIRETTELSVRYAHARTLYPEKLVREMMELTEEKIKTDDRGKTDTGRVQQIKVRVDAIKWIVSKLLPKKYGDRLTLAGDEDQPLTVVKIERTVVDPRPEVDDDGN